MIPANTSENIMNLRRVIPIYNSKELFLYEIIEDYKNEEAPEEKKKIVDSLCALIWSSANKRRLCKKSVRFHIPEKLADTDTGRVFTAWSEVEYTGYKSMTKDENWHSILRQKVNNIYTRYFDWEVILDKKYMDLLKTPKRLYYEWISGMDMEPATLTDLIDDAMDMAAKEKVRLQKEKMDLSWHDYKITVNGFIKKCLDNCKLIEEYEDSSLLTTRLDLLTEDHFYTAYFCKTLEQYFRNYQKQYYGLRRGHQNRYTRCIQCGALIEKTNNRIRYCRTCSRQLNQKEAKNRMRTYRRNRRYFLENQDSCR